MRYNLYSYCFNSPLNKVDRLGEYPVCLEVFEDCYDYDYDYGYDYEEQSPEAVDSFFDSILMYKEHKKKGTTNPANQNNHQKGEARRNRDHGNEKGDKYRTDRSNKRHNISRTEGDYSQLIGCVMIVVAVGVIAYLVINNITGIGVADDFAIAPAIKMLKRGLIMVIA